MSGQDVTDEMLAAYADGELDELNRARVERAVAQDKALAEKLAAYAGLRARLQAHFAPVAEEEVPERFRMLLAGGEAVAHDDGAGADNVVAMPVRTARPSFMRRAGWPMALAASLVIGLFVGRMPGGSGPVSVSGGRMVAQGALRSALDTELASAQGSAQGTGDAVRIGLSFKAKDGRWCRSFDSAAAAGVACHDDGAWQVQALVPGSGQETQYRQASSGDARVSATVEALIAGAPADADAEKAARDDGWK